MKNILSKLRHKVLIDDLIVKKMKYEINTLFFESPSKEKAAILAKKIHAQLDSALIGVDEADKESIRKLLILDSFLVLPNPTSTNIHYGHVFTTLTNFDDNVDDTKLRLMNWLDENTDYVYEEESLNQYIKEYKIHKTGKTIKTAASTYNPPYNRKPDHSLDEAIDPIFRYRFTKKALLMLVTFAAVMLLYFITPLGLYEKHEVISFIEPEIYDDTGELVVPEYLKTIHKVNIRIIPDEYKYKSLDIESITAFLDERNSILTEGSYLTDIDRLAEKFYIDPLLLVAIIGQEQGFVPKDHEYAEEIINNPYNVFSSWQVYNTTFEDATIICLNTITTAIENRPTEDDLIVFMNNKYSEDSMWHIGVTSLYNQMKALKK